ncbi:MAG: ABC transporter permease [Reichenbachiella sp.]
MFKSYLLICFRSIQKNKVFSFLNIVGLAIGMASCLLIFQYVSFESSFDQFHLKKDQVFRIDTKHYKNEEEKYHSSYTSYKMPTTLKETITGVANFTRTHLQYYGAVVTFDGEGENRRQFFEEDKRIYFVDQGFFEMFDYPLINGERSTLLTEPNSIVITKSMVDKYMPNVPNPIGQFLNIDGGWYPGTYKITGVLEDLPDNSIFSFGFLMPVHDLLKNEQYTKDDGWGWNNFVSYVMLDENATLAQVSELSKNLLNDRNKEDFEQSNNRSDVVYTSLNDLHLRDKSEENTGGISEQTLFYFGLIAIFIIGIAWLNFINLATAQSMKRAKEIGIRKVAGAVRRQLIFQFLIESFVINLISLVIAVCLAYMCLPILGNVIDAELVFGIGIKIEHWIYFGLAFLIGTLLSGFYPALVLSGYSPTAVIKGSSLSRQRRFGMRQILVVAQLVIGVFLISGTLAVFKQLQFMRNQDLGMNVDQVMSMRGPRVYDDKKLIDQKMKTFKQKLKAMPNVSEVSTSDAIPGGDYNWGTGMTKDGDEDSESQSVKMMWVDENFHNTYGLELLAGRFHSKDLKGEKGQVVVNETLLKKFALGTPEEAIGINMKVGDNLFPIIGVLKDYHWYSLKAEKEPVLLNFTEYGSNISVKLTSSDIQNTMAEIKEEYESQFINNPFDYYFMDNFFNRQYKTDEQFGYIFSAFSMVAIVIACLGLFGLASFTLNLRIKEIGIRKVLGASLYSILTMIFKDYLILILTAAGIGLPLVYLAISSWLESYAYRISISYELILLPIVLLMFVTVLTIGFQSLRAAMTNPASSLRSE